MKRIVHFKTISAQRKIKEKESEIINETNQNAKLRNNDEA